MGDLDRLPFSPGDVSWLLELMRHDTVSPLEGGDPGGIAAAQATFVAGAEERGLTLRRRDAPPMSFLDRAGVPEVVRQVATPEFLAAQPSVVVGAGAGQPPERRIVFNAHLDTVGPFRPPDLRHGRLGGRGAIDDKGPAVAAVAGVAAAFDADPGLSDIAEVLVASVPGEEGGAMGSYGTRWLTETGTTGRLMVFCEPTSGRFMDACSATMTPIFSIRGDDSTDDHPYAGHNATLALSFLSCLLAERLDGVARELGAKVCLAGLHTGHAHNRVYGTGELRLNIAYYDDTSATRLAAEVEEVFAAAPAVLAARFGRSDIAARLVADWSRVAQLRWAKRGLPALANRDATMEAVLESAGLPRHDGIADSSAFTCDAMWAAGAGRYAITCGPGSLATNGAHTPDEHVEIGELETYAARCRDLVLAFGDHLRRYDRATAGR